MTRADAILFAERCSDGQTDANCMEGFDAFTPAEPNANNGRNEARGTGAQSDVFRRS
jgi:hypothetical protein